MSDLLKEKDYTNWLRDLKKKLRENQLKAAVKANSKLFNFYWELGKEIVEKQKEAKWGDKLIDKLSKDLISEFPDVKGFSCRNLMYIQKWYLFYSGDKKLVQQAVALITKIPREHNLAIISKYKNPKEALFICKQGYRKRIVKKCLDSSNRSDLYKRSGKAITNFEITLPLIQSDLTK